MTFPDDENGDVLRRMQRNGDDLTKARDIDFSVAFAFEDAAKQFADLFRQRGYRVSVEQWETPRERPWDVTVTSLMLPIHADNGEMEETLDFAASPLGGCNDGWGSFAQPVGHYEIRCVR